MWVNVEAGREGVERGGAVSDVGDEGVVEGFRVLISRGESGIWVERRGGRMVVGAKNAMASQAGEKACSKGMTSS